MTLKIVSLGRMLLKHYNLEAVSLVKPRNNKKTVHYSIFIGRVI